MRGSGQILVDGRCSYHPTETPTGTMIGRIMKWTSVCVVCGAGDGAGDVGDESRTRDDESSG